MNYTDLINNITSNIKPNGHREITGQVLQDVLLNIAEFFEMKELAEMPLSFTPVGATANFKVSASSYATTDSKQFVLEYSKNDEEWQSYTLGTTINCNQGDVISLRGTGMLSYSSTAAGDTVSPFDWSGMTGTWKVYGNPYSLKSEQEYWRVQGAEKRELQYFFNSKGAAPAFTTLVDASELWLPSQLADNCFLGMFQKCTALTSAPHLGAVTLKQACYRDMFRDCTALEKAPVLIADAFANSCYGSMFRGCSALKEIEMWATQNLTYSGAISNWVLGVAANGTFKKKEAATLPSGNSGIPTDWTVVNIDA